MKVQNRLFGVEVEDRSEDQVLEKIKKYRTKRDGFCHIVSLNPENMVLTVEHKLFKKVVKSAQIRIVDGFGVVLAGQILGISIEHRLQGVDLMEKLLKRASEQRMEVMLIGGRGNLAEKAADCYRSRYPEAKVRGLKGIENIKRVKKAEEQRTFSIVARRKPRFVFVSFGSPYQELWLWKNRNKFKGAVCMGVGGAFEFLSGSVPRAPRFIRKLGLEWLFRLIIQPWRWRRQLRLIKFVFLVFKQKLGLL